MKHFVLEYQKLDVYEFGGMVTLSWHMMWTEPETITDANGVERTVKYLVRNGDPLIGIATVKKDQTTDRYWIEFACAGNMSSYHAELLAKYLQEAVEFANSEMSEDDRDD